MLFDIEVVIHEGWALDNSVYRKGPMALKTLDTFGKCQRPVFSLGVTMHNITNLKIWTQLVIENNKRRKKHPCCQNLCSDANIKDLRPDVF